MTRPGVVVDGTSSVGLGWQKIRQWRIGASGLVGLAVALAWYLPPLDGFRPEQPLRALAVVAGTWLLVTVAAVALKETGPGRSRFRWLRAMDSAIGTRILDWILVISAVVASSLLRPSAVTRAFGIVLALSVLGVVALRLRRRFVSQVYEVIPVGQEPDDPEAFISCTLDWSVRAHDDVPPKGGVVHTWVSKVRAQQARDANLGTPPGAWGEGFLGYILDRRGPEVDQLADALMDCSARLGLGPVEEARLVLGAVQSIPYVTDPESKGVPDYWRFPIETLADHVGDCEDTAILFAALMSAMGKRTCFIHAPGHAAVGVADLPQSVGQGVHHGGRWYAYSETTAEGFLFGELPGDLTEEDLKVECVIAPLVARMPAKVFTEDTGRAWRKGTDAIVAAAVVGAVILAILPFRGTGPAPVSSPGAIPSLVSLHIRPAAIAGGAASATVPGPLTVPQFLKAYRIDELHARGLTGEGVTVVVPSIDTFRRADLDSFARENRLPPFQVKELGTRPTWIGGEATMDLQIIHAIAPKATLVVDYHSLFDTSDDAEGLGGLLKSYPGSVWSISLGWCETDVPNISRAVARVMAKHAKTDGTSFFAASGDTGGYDCWNRDKPTDAVRAEYRGSIMPSSAPAVTAVGGTRLALDRRGAPLDESPWYAPAIVSGSGGGQSRVFPGRYIPDVSGNADPTTGMLFTLFGTTYSAGGTSASAPLWAGIAALTSQGLKKSGGGRLGPLNPLLDDIARSKSGTAVFRHPMLGSNAVARAAGGKDAVTGWGSPDATAFVDAVLAARGGRR